MRERRQRLAAVLAAAACLGAASASADPALDYMLHCQGCHRADGAPTPESIPALSGHVARFLAAPGGREFLVRVPGVAQSALDDERLAALLGWVLVRFDAAHLPPDFQPYTAAEVGELRRRPLTDVSEVRSRILTGGGAR